MSSAGDLIQEEARQIRKSRLESAGLSESYALWKEALPPETTDGDAYNTFMQSQATEEAAQQGRVSVSTGGTEKDADTEIPTPGPDGEKTGPDGDGEASKGTGDRDTDLKFVEGMWQPPKEADTENYEAPSTYKMSRSTNWITNARVIYDYMNPEGRPQGQISYMSGMAPPKKPELTNEEIGSWARNELSGFNWNVLKTAQYAQKLTTDDIDPKIAIAFLNLINMYDHSDGSMMDFAGALQEIATDPTTYVGFGVGSVAAKGASKALVKTGLKKWLQGAIIGSVGGSFEGGMIAGGFDLTVQNIEQEAGSREDIDYGRAGVATAAGIGLGSLLGGAGGAYVGRKADKLIKLIDDYNAQNKARDSLLKLDPSGVEARESGLRDYVDQMAKSEDPSEVAFGTAVISRILDDNGNFPRLDDGGLDFDVILKVMDDIRVEQANRTRLDKLREKYPPSPDEPIGNRNTPEKEKAVLEAKAQERRDPDFYTGQSRATVETIERGGYKVQLGEEGDLLFDLAGMSGTQIDKIQAAADKAGVKIVSDAFPNAPGDQIDVSEFIVARGDDEAMAKFAEILTGDVVPFPRRVADRKNLGGANEDFVPDISDPESQKLINKILEMQELEAGDIVLRSEGRPGSRVIDKMGDEFEVVGRTKNGWYRLRNNLGQESNLRRKSFEVIDKAPAPRKAGPMELDPFGGAAAKIIEMNERILKEPNKLVEVKTTHKEQAALAKDLEELGIVSGLLDKPIYGGWAPHELLALRNTYEKQANGIMDLAKQLESRLRNEGRLLDSDLARFNNAHSMFVATRDLFYGVSGNAARQLNILRSKPVSGVYDFSQSLMDSIGIQGGRANTERAITLMSEFASQKRTRGKKAQIETLTNLSKNIWGNPTAAMLLNIRYNMMLSSWRTHFFNFLGNSASGVYQHLMVSPVKMGINNLQYMRELAWAKLAPGTKYGDAPDPADRLTRHQWYAELRGHYSGARDSWMLAKEILMGRDIGEGKVWAELGLRYNVINVPETAVGKTLTTPVRALEAGDAFFKNQYYNSKMHEIASTQARWEEVHGGKNYKDRYQHYLDNPDELGGSAERQARDFAQKQTYTNDPNIYGGILSVLAESTAKAQNKSLLVNMIIPFVRTPANLLSYSMEMIGANTVLSPSRTYQSIMKGTAQESQEALSRLTIAAGLWLVVAEMHQNGDITGTGPTNWEERKVWEAAGWQPNSAMIWGEWYSMDRAAPAGQSLATIASVFDYYAMTQQTDKPAMEWVGAGLLYTADMILDESYLSTAMDVVTAVSSKEESRIRSASSSMITSIFVPNLIRDLRRPADATMRSTTSTNLLDQMQKQMMNASPWHSDDLAPQRDWKGDPKDYYGNVYHRALVPFNVRDPSKSDAASMAIAYARIPVAIPNKTISWPKGRGDAIDLFAMDDGQGYVYDEYLKIMGSNRKRAAETLMDTNFWRGLVKDGNIGPGSDGDMAMRTALSMGSRFGRLEMLGFLIEHSGENNTYKRIGPDGKEVPYLIQHSVSVDTYIELQKAVRREGYDLTEEEKQYIIRKPVEGPEFFKP